MENLAQRSNEQVESRLNQIPTPEDWVTLQGGKPLIYFRPPGRPTSKGVFFVVHVYGEPYSISENNREDQYGLVVATPYDQMLDSLNYPGTYEVPKSELSTSKIIKVPNVLLATHHGLPCLDRSRASTSIDQGSGVFINDLTKFNSTINEWSEKKYIEYRLGVNSSGGFALRPK